MRFAARTRRQEDANPNTEESTYGYNDDVDGNGFEEGEEFEQSDEPKQGEEFKEGNGGRVAVRVVGGFTTKVEVATERGISPSPTDGAAHMILVPVTHRHPQNSQLLIEVLLLPHTASEPEGEEFMEPPPLLLHPGMAGSWGAEHAEEAGAVRCPFSGRNLHTRGMPLDPTHVRLKPFHACNQWPMAFLAEVHPSL
jgi:hypothetical protein